VSVEAQRLAAHHERRRRVVEVQEEAVGTVVRRQQRADRLLQLTGVARHHQHRHGVAIVGAGADDEVPRHARQIVPGGTDARLHQLVAQTEGDAVGARALHRAFLHRHDLASAGGIVPHHQAAAARPRTEDERRLVAEVPGHAVVADRHADDWRHRRQGRRGRAEERVEGLALAGELRRIGDVLPLTAAAAAGVPAAGHDRRVGHYFTPSSSTSNTRPEFGGMSAPAPRAP
jgi:hypothetical protein